MLGIADAGIQPVARDAPRRRSGPAGARRDHGGAGARVGRHCGGAAPRLRAGDHRQHSPVSAGRRARVGAGSRSVRHRGAGRRRSRARIPRRFSTRCAPSSSSTGRRRIRRCARCSIIPRPGARARARAPQRGRRSLGAAASRAAAARPGPATCARRRCSTSPITPASIRSSAFSRSGDFRRLLDPRRHGRLPEPAWPAPEPRRRAGAARDMVEEHGAEGAAGAARGRHPHRTAAERVRGRARDAARGRRR